MKKVLKSLLIVLLFVLAVNISFSSDCKANSNVVKSSEKVDLLIVRTVENDVTYISIYTDSGIFITKFEEL